MLALTIIEIGLQMTATAILSPVKPCVKCGATDRDNRGVCNPCQKRRAAEYYRRNAAKIADAQRARIAANPEQRKASKDKWRAKNTASIKSTQSSYNAKHKAQLDAKRKQWREANKDKAAATRQTWLAKNKHVRDSYNHNRRAMKVAAGGKLSPNIVLKLLVAQKGKCPCCRGDLGSNHHLDHIVPLALGGTNTDDNVQLLRARCNLEKSKKHPVDFMQERGFLL